jgi:hypothetical protein
LNKLGYDDPQLRRRLTARLDFNEATEVVAERVTHLEYSLGLQAKNVLDAGYYAHVAESANNSDVKAIRTNLVKMMD